MLENESEEECPYCLGQGEHWPINEQTWCCPKCGAEYFDETED